MHVQCVGTALQMSTFSGLVGFVIFNSPSRLCTSERSGPSLPEEHVLIISRVTATGAMPVTAGFIFVIPALKFLLDPNELVAFGGRHDPLGH